MTLFSSIRSKIRELTDSNLYVKDIVTELGYLFNPYVPSAFTPVIIFMILVGALIICF